MVVVGFDLGGKKLHMAKWEQDVHGLNEDGVPNIVQTDLLKSDAITRCCFGRKQVLICSLAGKKYVIMPESSVEGCLQYFYQLTGEEVDFWNRINASVIISEGDITYFDLSFAGATSRQMSVLVLTSFYLEYVIYCVLRDSHDMYSIRRHIAAKQSIEDGVWTMTIPDRFSTREVEMLRTINEWSGHKNFFYIKSCLAIAIENGYYECSHHNITDPVRYIYVDVGATHTTLFVVCYSDNQICLEYIRDVPGVSGNHFTLKMLECVLTAERLDQLRQNPRKKYMGLLDDCEEKKKNLNPNGQSVRFDLMDYFDDLQYVEVTMQQFNEKCSDLVRRFTDAVNEMCDTVNQFNDGIPVAKVFPVGGSMRIGSLQSELKTCVENAFNIDKLSYLQMDECAVMGTATFAHLLDKRCVKLDPSLAYFCIFSQDPVDWNSFSSSDSDCVVYLHEYAVVDLGYDLEYYEETGFDAEKPSFDLYRKEILDIEDELNQMDSVISDISKQLSYFQSAERSRNLFFTKGQLFLHKQPYELIGEKTCDGHVINWAGVFEGKTTRNGKWWSRWNKYLEKRQKQLQETEEEFKSRRVAIQRMIRMGKASLSKKQVEEDLRYLQTVESDYNTCLEQLQWGIDSVKYQVMNRMGVYKRKKTTH